MRKFTILSLAVLVLAGCRSNQAPPETLQLKLAVNDIYCKDTACACVHYIAARTYPDIQQKLQDEFGIDLQLNYYIEPYNLEKAILSGAYDGAISKPWTALMLEREAGADFVRIADIIDPDNNQWLSGIVVVMADSEFQTLEELQGRRIVIGESDAYEKHYAAKRLFEEKGVQFGTVGSTASCIENLGQLMDGKWDAAVVSDYAVTADCAVDFASPDDFRILARTEKIPLTSVVLDAGRIPETDRVRLQAALLAISKEGASETMLSRGFVEPADWNPAEVEK